MRTSEKLETDYLVVGSGAMGMAFVDTLLAESDASCIMVDRHHKPGGHWNDAYPFVRLHQPSAFYGVNSTELGFGEIDQLGWNEGLYELASSAEVCSYFDRIMNLKFLPSSRVQYFPMANYLGNGSFKSLVNGREQSVKVNKKIVDATYMHVTVPSMRPPDFKISKDAHCAPLNDLATLDTSYDDYVVIGAGKTGMDACLWLLSCGVDPASIRWIMPRDSWYLNRRNIQPGAEFFASSIGSVADQMEIVASASDQRQMFESLCAAGVLLRLDDSVWPTMYRCATVTEKELAALRQIDNVIRMGRVEAITAKEILLTEGSIPTTANTFHVDCTADGLEQRPVKPIFETDHICLQTVRHCQQVFSAAFIAHVEATYHDQAEKNQLCTVVPHPDSGEDWLRTTLANTHNAAAWSRDNALQQWLNQARLNFASSIGVAEPNKAQQQVLERIQANTEDAMKNLTHFLKD